MHFLIEAPQFINQCYTISHLLLKADYYVDTEWKMLYETMNFFKRIGDKQYINICTDLRQKQSHLQHSSWS